LNDIRGSILVAEHPAGEVINAPMVPLVQRLERRAATSRGTEGEFVVRTAETVVIPAAMVIRIVS
jgi:hypothetical protein